MIQFKVSSLLTYLFVWKIPVFLTKKDTKYTLWYQPPQCFALNSTFHKFCNGKDGILDRSITLGCSWEVFLCIAQGLICPFLWWLWRQKSKFVAYQAVQGCKFWWYQTQKSLMLRNLSRSLKFTLFQGIPSLKPVAVAVLKRQKIVVFRIQIGHPAQTPSWNFNQKYGSRSFRLRSSTTDTWSTFKELAWLSHFFLLAKHALT